MTGLHWAAKKGYVKMAQLLIDNGAYVDAKDIVIFYNRKFV